MPERVQRNHTKMYLAAFDRVVSECRFFINTLKEALLHPLSKSMVDKRTGRVVGLRERKLSRS